jgi:hypothetical protein
MERLTILETEIIETKILKSKATDYEERIRGIVQEVENKNRKIHELENLLEESNIDKHKIDLLEREISKRNQEIDRLKIENILSNEEDLKMNRSLNDVSNIIYLLIEVNMSNRFFLG